MASKDILPEGILKFVRNQVSKSAQGGFCALAGGNDNLLLGNIRNIPGRKYPRDTGLVMTVYLYLAKCILKCWLTHLRITVNSEAFPIHGAIEEVCSVKTASFLEVKGWNGLSYGPRVFFLQAACASGAVMPWLS